MFITGKFFPRLISILIFFSIFYVPSLAWAELKPGDIITKDNWEKVKDIAPKLVLDAVKKGGYPLKIIEMPFLYPEEYWEATRKYSGAVKLDADGGLVNYVAGLPFGTTYRSKRSPCRDQDRLEHVPTLVGG